MSALRCGFRAFHVLRGYYPAGIARRFRPFVDLLLTRRLDSKKPRGEAGHKRLILIQDFGCGSLTPPKSTAFEDRWTVSMQAYWSA